MKKVIITGNTNGFGLAYSNIFKKNGWKVIGISRSNNDYNLDLSTIEGTHKLIDIIKKNNPKIIILNAGYGKTKRFEEYSEKDILRMQHINGTGKALILNHFFNEILQGKMKFIVASSIAGKIPSPLMAGYSASKAYISNLIDSLNGEIFSQDKQNWIIDATPGNINTSEMTGEIIEYAGKVINSEEKIVFNKEFYREVIKKPLNNWEEFVKNSYDRKLERINDKKR